MSEDNKRPTPITDAHILKDLRDNMAGDYLGRLNRMIPFARDLERQLAEARDNAAAMRRIASACQCPSKDADIAILKGQLAEARREAEAQRDSAHTAWAERGDTSNKELLPWETEE